MIIKLAQYTKDEETKDLMSMVVEETIKEPLTKFLDVKMVKLPHPRKARETFTN